MVQPFPPASSLYSIASRFFSKLILSRMKKLSIYYVLCLLLCLLVFNNTSSAQQLTKNEAKKAISSFLKIKSKSTIDILDIYSYKRTEVPFIYIAKLKPEGFIILANDKRSYPILAYSFNSKFDFQNIPPVVLEMLNQYEFIIDYRRNNSGEEIESIMQAWKNLEIENSMNDNKEYVDPLISTAWNQNRYYNDFCPLDSSVYPNMNYHTPAGCVAIAMAQLINYHEHPIRGVGEDCYIAPGYGEQCANYGLQDYLFDQMPDELSEYNNEVARLIYHCGVSVEMAYGPYGSFAFMPNVKYALIDHFRYKDEINRLFKSNFAIEEWANLLLAELNMGLPLMMCGSGVNGTHAFLCDGYDQDGLFHYNWGWGGSFNGYFEIGNLNPGAYHFDENQEAFFNVTPLLTGIENINEKGEFSVYPNPANDYINISGWRENTIYKIEIYNLNSEIVSEIDNPTSKIRVSNLSSGMYILKIFSDNSCEGFKLLKQ